MVGVLELLNLTNQWKYNQAGIDLGTSWRTTNYNDAAWASGRGLFYIETASLPAAKHTPLAFTNPRQTTFYFRTHFQMPSNANAVVLTSSNLIDDGAVFYINGMEAARIGMSNGPVFYATLAERTVDNATNFDVIKLPNTNLVVGDNVLAVEVHQHATDSTDIVFGASLHAAFTRQVPMRPRLKTPTINENFVHLTALSESGYLHVLDVSTNLSNWAPLRTNTALTGEVQFDLPFIPSTGGRFYRMRVIDAD
ncbi:MAG: metallophosphoesterase [Verrucomicrobiales bacterium]|nr:metallophosphoesterase [Verrucomicrobiales bacterium]